VRRSLETGEPYELELDLIRADGVMRKTVARGEVVRDAEGRITRLHGTLQDITERAQLKQQLYEAKKLESIGQLVAGVAHEVRNPLNAILTVTEALFREPVLEGKAELTPYIGHIRSQVTRLSQLMHDLLDLGKSIPSVNLIPVPLAELCCQTVSLWQHTGLAENRQVVFDGGQGMESVQVRVDSSRLQQVLFNLLENAGQHTPSGCRIQLKLSGLQEPNGVTGSDRAVVQVVDQGSGIPPGKLTQVFDPFYTGRRGGTGLGLSLVKHFMEQMGGTVQICNNYPDTGCTATLTIPVEPDRNVA
jgi:two-component system NtrC family sensor kinase